MLFFCLMTLALGSSMASLVNRATFGNSLLKYYNYQDDEVNALGATVKCIQRGGTLVMPKTAKLNTAVTGVTGGHPVWIGLGDFGPEGAYTWIDGSHIEWARWRSDEPNDFDNSEDCVETSDYWNDLSCEFKRGYVCQMPNAARTIFEHSHVKVYSGVNETSYDRAAEICKRSKSRLVKINDESEHSEFSRKFNTNLKSFWEDKEISGISPCYSASAKGPKLDNCEQTKPFICESVEPHDLVVSQETPESAVSTDLEILCSASGVPVPRVTWYRNGIRVENQSQQEGLSTLSLQDLTAEDAGLYVCRASNVIDHKEYTMEGYSILNVTSAVHDDSQ